MTDLINEDNVVSFMLYAPGLMHLAVDLALWRHIKFGYNKSLLDFFPIPVSCPVILSFRYCSFLFYLSSRRYHESSPIRTESRGLGRFRTPKRHSLDRPATARGREDKPVPFRPRTSYHGLGRCRSRKAEIYTVPWIKADYAAAGMTVTLAWAGQYRIYIEWHWIETSMRLPLIWTWQQYE